MDFPVKTGAPASQRTACAVLPIFEGVLRGPAKEVDAAARGLLRQLIRNGDASSKLGSTLLVPQIQGTAADRLLLVGCGKEAEFNSKRLCTAMNAAVTALKSTGIKEAISYLTHQSTGSLDPYYATRLSVETARSAVYRFDELKSEAQPKLKLNRLGIAVGDPAAVGEARRGIKDGIAVANGMDLARDLGNRPPNVCTPSHIAAAARDVAQRFEKIDVDVLAERDLKRLGMGAFLSVTQGAEEPARLIVLHYRGASKELPPVALCGKGITFDTGGISLKPPPKMDEMKFDMCGAAGVLGTMATIGELQPEINVVAIIPSCENMPSGKATRPGDIVTSMSGKTIEILNTDAEGRLILCDALTYAKQFEPRYVLDVATLTGACVVALGHLHTGLFCNDDALAAALLAASSRSLDSAWRLPSDDEYAESLSSNFADVANAGSREGGASVAAAFLAKFVDNTPWAHLDIAGVAWRGSSNKGATGRPVPLLVDFLLNLEPAAAA